MDWLKDGTTWEVVQEWRKRYPNYDDAKIDTLTLREILVGEKIVVQHKSGRFMVMTKEAADKANREPQKKTPVPKQPKVKKPKIKVLTEKQFRKHLKEVAQDTVADGIVEDIDSSVAYDLAECQLYDFGVQQFLKTRYPDLQTKQQKIEFVADLIAL